MYINIILLLKTIKLIQVLKYNKNYEVNIKFD